MSARPFNYKPVGISSGLHAAANRSPDKIALRFEERTLTFATLDDRVRRVTGLVRHGLGLSKGTNAALLAPNCLEYLEIVCGAADAGVAVATLNPKLVTREIEYTCNDCEAAVLFVHPELATAVQDADLPTVKRIVVLGEEYEALLQAASPTPPVEFEEWDPFVIHYTSGTTGEPKGVVLPHRARALLFFAMATEYGCYSPDDRYLATAPLFHGAGFAFAMAAIFFGGHAEILPRYDPDVFLNRMREGAFTGTFLVPTHFHALFELPPRILGTRGPETLRTIVANAAPLAQATKERIVEYFGDDILHETYGSTEIGIATNLRPRDQLRKERSVGLPFVCTHVKLLDEEGNLVKTGEVGELFTDSPFKFNGYFNRPEETQASMRGDWFSAGDLARQDEEGYLYLVDRKKDMVISGGVNIYPREIEEALFRIEGVLEAAVIGVPDARWGESLLAYIVPRPHARLETENVLAALRQELASFKVPRTVRYIETLPRNASGKVLKRELRERESGRGR